MRELYGLFLKMEEETKDVDPPKSVEKKNTTNDLNTQVGKAPRTVLPAIDKIKMQPTDLFEINTSQFASSLSGATTFVSRPEIA
jgi:hypothetical protein